MIEYMVDSGKTYEGEITLGFATTTEDVSGEIVEKPVTAPLSTEQIDQAMAEMTGEITQIPPMFSAVKVNGKRLYEYARNGEEVERPQRKAMIYSFERTSEPILTNPLIHKVGGLKWSVAKEPMCGHYQWILAKIRLSCPYVGFNENGKWRFASCAMLNVRRSSQTNGC